MKKIKEKLIRLLFRLFPHTKLGHFLWKKYSFLRYTREAIQNVYGVIAYLQKRLPEILEHTIKVDEKSANSAISTDQPKV